MSNRDIADEIGWEGDADQLIAALVDAGWLDRSERYRLIVHDWAEHADNGVKSTRIVKTQGFASESDPATQPDSVPTQPGSDTTQPTCGPTQPGSVDTELSSAGYGYGYGLGNGSGAQGGGAGGGNAHALSGRWPQHLLGSILSAYPKRVKPLKAQAAIDRALCRIADRENPPPDPVQWLLERVQAYAASPAARGQYVQDPHNWFDDGRFDESPSEWGGKRPATVKLGVANAG